MHGYSIFRRNAKAKACAKVNGKFKVGTKGKTNSQGQHEPRDALLRIDRQKRQGHVVRGRVAGTGDPGNRATTKLVCKAILCLALQPDDLPGGRTRGGLLTSASGWGCGTAGQIACRWHAA